MEGTLFAILVVLSLAASSYADGKSEVNTLINQYEAAWQSGDVNAVQACFTEDAIFMPPGRDAAKGREEILKMYTAMYQIADVHALDLKLEEFEYTFSADGDFAYLWGPYNSFHKDGSIFKLGKGMAVVKKVDGLFKLHVVNINHDDNPSLTQTKDPMQDEIDALTRFHEAAWRKRDYEGGASVYVESGVAMVPGMEPVRGKKEIARLFEAQMKMGVTNVKYEHQDVVSTADGQMGYAWCYYTFFGKDGSVLDHGKGMIIAKRVNGEVKLIAGIFNQNSPPAHIPGFTQSQKSLEAEVEVLRNEFLQAWSRQDSRGVADCFAKDGMLLSPGKDVVQGREEIAQVFNQLFLLGLVSLKAEAKEVIQSAHPHWFEWGYYTFLDKNGNDIIDHGKYMVIGTRENGKVKLYKDMFNSNTNLPLPGRHDEL